MISSWKRPIASALILGAALALLAGCAPERVPVSTPTVTKSSTPAPPVDKPKSFFNKKQFSVDDSTSIWVVVNKLRPLQPANYVPALVTAAVPHIYSPRMTQEAAAALVTMFAASAADSGGTVQVQNSYRSFTTQTNTHDYYIDTIGAAKADAQSARPGYSEHQTGLAVDIAALPSKCDIAACFGQTPQGIWLAANSWKYGYILRYPADQTPITGYIYEPWHFRYVGVALATEMHDTGVTTLEVFFGLPAAPDYAN